MVLVVGGGVVVVVVLVGAGGGVVVVLGGVLDGGGLLGLVSAAFGGRPVPRSGGAPPNCGGIGMFGNCFTHSAGLMATCFP